MQAVTAAGFTAEKILQLLMRNPSMKKKITSSLAAGFSADKIVRFFTKDKNFQKLRDEMEKDYPLDNNSNPIVQGQNIRSKNLGSDMASGLQRSVGPILSTAAAAGTSYALGRAIPKILQSGAQAPSLTSAIQGQTQTQQETPVQQTSQPPINPIQANTASIPEPTNIQQPKQNSNIVDKLWTSFEKGRDKGFDFESDAFLKIAKRMKSTGEINSKEDFEKFFNLFDAKKNEGKDLPTALKEASGEFDNQRLSPIEQPEIKEEKIIDFSGMGKGMTDNLYNGLFESLKKGSTKFAGIEDPLLKAAKSEFDAGNINSPEDLKKFSKEVYNKPKEAKIEKNSTVIAPQGVGEVKAIRNGKALIEVDGKRHEVDESELESSPIPEKDLGELYDDLIKGIEGETKEDVSRMVQWAGYNPDSNTLQFLPHTGDMYTYDDISEEDAALLRDVLSVRKTSGSNFIGAWKKDSKSPIGAALSKLIKKLQSERGGKGNEYSAKHGTIYSAYEPAIQAKKKKKKT